MLAKLFVITFLLACVTACVLTSSHSHSANQNKMILDDDSESSPLSISCMKCICKVMGCIKDEGCVNKTCGTMHLTQGYWESAHYKPSDPANVAAFEKCANNVWCAARTVQRHMSRFLSGCEAKRTDRLRCENALALHKFGPERCDKNLTSSIERKLHSCLDKAVWRWLNDL